MLYEIIRRDKPTAAEIAKELGLDAGYLSRILRGFEARGFIVRETSAHDGRQSLPSVTPRGRESFAPVELQTIEDVTALLAVTRTGRRSDSATRCRRSRACSGRSRGFRSFCAATTRGHGLDGERPRHCLQPRIRLERSARGSNGRGRRRVHAQARSAARALLDR